MRAYAPGRVNLIGDHTDYTGGVVLPMAVDLRTTVELQRGGRTVELVSATEAEPAVVPLDVADPARMSPGWARYVAGVVAAVRPAEGGSGRVTTTLPQGAGLSSSAALEVALALALGFEGSDAELAGACQRAEQLAWGTPTGIMDQLASVAGRAGHALLIDCTSLEVVPVPIPDSAEVVVVDSGERRSVALSAYAERRRQCEDAAARVGPLREVSLEDVARLDDPLLQRRARHVVSENRRVVGAAKCLDDGDLVGAGRLMTESHASLRDDFEVSTPRLDRLVEELLGIPGIYGARLTGAGFGGSVVALARPGTPTPGRPLAAADGARVEGSPPNSGGMP
ncbi:MAG TPA: galactokinase [Acidimicrobiales bacterium]|nr:galactokinase [Acidimicrobiales bacterium]